MLNPIESYRNGLLTKELEGIDIEELKQMIKKYMPDPTRKVYRLKSEDLLRDYIIHRAESIATKGDVFYTD